MGNEKVAWQDPKFRIIEGGKREETDSFNEGSVVVTEESGNIIDFRVLTAQKSVEENPESPIEMMIVKAKQRFFGLFK